ncbi:cytochrome c oxidase subunit IV-domain-containing protein [Crassisporium funariophilum]|nr:cytochrome c oxidase subunit IV-domain-containing protein [Crassisporium funariophilum]KAF8163769.1 cytochrome c oxidase subunit IV-domain-containing protein [Crassisporium funariophilum]
MQALRLARTAAVPLARRRCLATATANHVEVASSNTVSAASSSRIAPVPLSNVEAQWEKLNAEEKLAVHEQLEALQKKDWTSLSLDEKKAAYYVAFGPHGPRAPTSQPGDGLKITLATTALVGLAGLLFYGIKSMSPAPPKSLTKEWQEASNERALEMKLNPITGISSEDYKGKGFVQSK